MTQRTIKVADEAPEAQIEIVDEQNETVENVLGGGDEYIKVTVTDYDDTSMEYTETFQYTGLANCIFSTY